MEITPGDSGLGSTRESTHACTGQGYVVPPVTQLCWPVACAPDSSVRLANAAHDSPWSMPSMLSFCQISASIADGERFCARLR
jgi:hypothetical protein